MSNSDDKNNNSNVNEHRMQTLTHRTVIGEKKNGKIQNETDSIHDTVDPNFKPQLRWPDLCAQLFLHAGAIYALVFQFYTIKFYTFIWCKYCIMLKKKFQFLVLRFLINVCLFVCVCFFFILVY